MCTKQPEACARKRVAAARDVLKLPLRCTSMTASQSASVILWKMASRRIPALFTTTSMRPKQSIACSTILCAASKSATLSKFASASPPPSRIALTVASAGVRSSPSPEAVPPGSFTITFAPCAPSILAISAPTPRPAPVTRAAFPSTSFVMNLSFGCRWSPGVEPRAAWIFSRPASTGFVIGPGRFPVRRIARQRRDVTEHAPRLGEVGDRADAGFKTVHGRSPDLPAMLPEIRCRSDGVPRSSRGDASAGGKTGLAPRPFIDPMQVSSSCTMARTARTTRARDHTLLRRNRPDGGHHGSRIGLNPPRTVHCRSPAACSGASNSAPVSRDSICSIRFSSRRLTKSSASTAKLRARSGSSNR